MYQMDRGFGEQEIEYGETVSPLIYKDRVEVQRKQAEGSLQEEQQKGECEQPPSENLGF